MSTVTIGEYRTSDEVLPIEIAHQLVAAADGALTLGSPEAGGVRLVAHQHVGTVSIGHHDVRIVPKAPMANVLAMLAASTQLTSWHPQSSSIATQDDLLRTTVAFLAHNASRLLAGGPQRAYVRQEELLVAPRGRVRFQDSARRGGLPAPVPCAFDELTTDTLLNRYLLTAINRSLRVAGLDHLTRRKLTHVKAALPEVLQRPLAADAIDQHHFTRLDDRYRPTIALARILLERLSLQHEQGEAQTQNFTVDMNRLFEAWIGARLAHHMPKGFRIATQTSRHLDTTRRLAVHPDLELRHGGQPVYVADTKYKLTASGLGRVADYYQAHAYATILGLNEAMLIYCDADGQTPARSLEVVGSEVTVLTHSVRISGSGHDLDEEVHRLSGHLVQRATSTDETPTGAAPTSGVARSTHP